MTSRPRLLGLVLMLCAGWLAAPMGRADMVYLADGWRTPAAVTTPFKRLLAAGITTDAPTRRRLEDRFVSMLRAHDVGCLTSYSIVPTLPAPEDRQKVVDMLMAQQVDGVITVSLVPLKETTEEEWAAAWRQALEQPGRLRDYVDAALRRPPEKTKRFGAEITLWNLATGERVWAARTAAGKINKIRDAAPNLVDDVMNDLIHARLL
ncbi:MAG TPA: hypothetical protein VFB95_11185 [Candidatus Cryosericum sp.]|nr:hypothetical protein [Candidatus Cryosericum sp.]